MTRTKIGASALAGALLVWLVAPHLFAQFPSVRLKVVRTEMPASGEQRRIPIPPEVSLEALHPPFAAISRVRNDGNFPLVVRVAVDDREICSAEIPAAGTQRIDCSVRGPWVGRDNHSVLFSAASPGYTVEYFELATHFGSLTPGPRDVIVVPEGFTSFRQSSAWHALVIFILITLSIVSVRHKPLPRVISIIHLVLAAVLAGLLAVVILFPSVSTYRLLIAPGFLEKWLFLTALPVLATGTSALFAWMQRHRPDAVPVARAMGIGVTVGAIYLSFAGHTIAEHYNGNPSGLIHISRHFFDKSPMSDRADVRNSVRFSDGKGYDGQFFYYMTFDPFLAVFRHEPSRYLAFIDNPPYRYGRIGFSFLTKILSIDRPTRYPATMVAIVISSLAACGTLLALIAQRYGRSAWTGGLVLLVPGFWMSADSALPEPLAVALFLAAFLCVFRDKWLAAGALLGMSMLVRETGGALVLALIAGIVLAGKWRAGAIVALLAFLPVVIWKGFLGWVFWADFGMAGVMPHPNDVGVPFTGVIHVWNAIARGEYFDGSWEFVRSGLTFPILTTAGAVLAVIAAVKRPGPMAVAALVYAVLTITFNYEGVWLHVGNAQRLTIDLFVALALVYVQTGQGRRLLPKTFAIFWGATACYLLFWTFHAADVRQSFFPYL